MTGGRRGRRAVVAVLLGLATTACAGVGDRTEVLVSGAASLTDVLADVETAYEAANPDVDVVLNLGGSSALREQLLAGAPAAVFAPADENSMTAVADAGLVAGEPVPMATNELVLAVPADDPGGVAGIEDLAREELFVGLCRTTVPCGSLADATLAAAGVVAAVDTREPDVRAVLAKLVAGDLDAGFVYATDVAASGGAVVALPLPAGVARSTVYPVAVVEPEQPGARDVVRFLLGPEGRALLAGRGFGLP